MLLAYKFAFVIPATISRTNRAALNTLLICKNLTFIVLVFMINRFFPRKQFKQGSLRLIRFKKKKIIDTFGFVIWAKYREKNNWILGNEDFLSSQRYLPLQIHIHRQMVAERSQGNNVDSQCTFVQRRHGRRGG